MPQNKFILLAAKIGLAIASTALTLGFIELALRLTMDDPRSFSPAVLADPDYGWRWAGHEYVRGRDLHGELKTEWWTNSLGFYDVDHDTAHPKSVRRILFIGDSFTVGGAVLLKETFVKRVEEALSSLGGRWECLNMGVSGYGTGQELQLYEKIGRQFDPDIVIVSFCVDNDIADNHPQLSEPRPYFILKNGSLVFQPIDVSIIQKSVEKHSKIQQSFFKSCLHQSYLWTLKRAVAVQIRAKMRESPAITRIMRGLGFWKEKQVSREWGHFIIKLPPEERRVWDEAHEVTVRTIRLFNDKVRKDGHQLLLVLVPSQLQVYEDSLRMFQSFYINFGADAVDLNKTSAFLKTSLAGDSIPIIDPLPAFRAHSSPDRLYYKHDFHLTPAGHKELARAITAYLQLAAIK